ELLDRELSQDICLIEEVFLDQRKYLSIPDAAKFLSRHFALHEVRVTDGMMLVEIRSELLVEGFQPLNQPVDLVLPNFLVIPAKYARVGSALEHHESATKSDIDTSD